MAEKKVKVTLVKSLIGTKQSHRATVRGLGLRRLNSTAELEDTPAVRGMINKGGLPCEVRGLKDETQCYSGLPKGPSKRVGGLVAVSDPVSGKTAGRGHKGQKSRAGGFHKVGFRRWTDAIATASAEAWFRLPD